MSRASRRALEDLRASEGPVVNTLIDECVSGEMDRAELLKRASMFGLGASAIGIVLAGLGEAPVAFAKMAAGKAGGRLRLGIDGPLTGTTDPWTFNNHGGVVVGGITGEYLIRGRQANPLTPELAVKWSPNANAQVWTYQLRPNVHFQNGQVMTADDVVATYKRLTDPNSGSQALSAFEGVLTPDGVQKVDDLTVAFHLESPNANFPYLTSSTTYQAIILPANFQAGSFTSTPQTTGAFKITAYTPGVSVKYDRYPGWWGGQSLLDGVDATMYGDDAASVSAMLGGTEDLISQTSYVTGRALFHNPNVKIFSARGAAHRTIAMRVDRDPFKDYRVRQALALTLDRPAIIKAILGGFGSLGNDSPFAGTYPSTAKTVAQRHQDLKKAKQLLEAAGASKGFTVTLTGNRYLEIPQLAQIFQASARKIGVNVNIKILPVQVYYGGSDKTTPWLNALMPVTDWGHRAVPNVIATSTLTSKGTWNASRYRSKKYDALLKSFVAAVSVKDQRRYSRLMQELLLHDTPEILPYFNGWVMPGTPKLRGFEASPDAQTYLSKASLA